MYNRNFDSSQLTRRRQEKAIAGSFLTKVGTAPNNNQIYGTQPIPGIRDASLMYSVKSGHMTQYTRYPTCIGISPGCPCPEVNSSLIVTPYQPTIPGPVSGITFTVGSIIVSWNQPSSGSGPFTYIVTPYLNGVAQTPVTTYHTFYRFTGLQEWQPYTFTVCATNQMGQGPVMPSSSYFIAPPEDISSILSGNVTQVPPEPSLKYIINTSLNTLLNYIASINLDPTKSSRLIYLWSCSIAQAWNWVSSESRITGIHDQWNWNNKLQSALNDNNCIIWMTVFIDYITPFFIPGPYNSIFKCSNDIIDPIKGIGRWNDFISLWNTWFTYRQNDGYSSVITQQPTNSANWNESIIIDNTTVNNISSYPQPRQWTRLTVQGKKQGYLTYNWDNILSTCFTENDELKIENLVSPSVNHNRDNEIDSVLQYSENLTDEQKIIAEFWAGGPGTVSPPCMCIWLWKEYIKTISVSCSNIIYSLLDLSIHLFEGGRLTWRLKKKYMEARPIQEIRRRYTGQSIPSWNGTIDGSQWIPYQAHNFVTPPFADFPSGHSHFSKAFALTMNKWFGLSITKNSSYYDRLTLMSPLFSENQNGLFGDFTIGVGRSEVEPNITPKQPITLSFSAWDEMANQSGMSRLYGGIHAITAHTSSQTTAIEVDNYITSTWNIQTISNIISQTISPVPHIDPVIPTDPIVPIVPVEPIVPIVPVEPIVPVVPVEPIVPVVPIEPIVTVEPYKIQINYITSPPSTEIQNLINSSKTILESIIAESHGLRLDSISKDYDMIVDVSIQSLGQGILASAKPTFANASVIPAMPLRQSVTINSDALNISSLLSNTIFNDNTITKIIPVLVHEMLHGLGIAAITNDINNVGWEQFLDNTQTWYVGPNGDTTKSKAIKAYQEIVGNEVHRIPVENSFGRGTAYSHWEEGLTSTFQPDYRYFDYGNGNIFHPALPDEIMTGVAGSRFYLTKLTTGALEDHGYKINYESSNIVPYPITSIQKN